MIEELNRLDAELEDREAYIKKLEDNQSIQDQFLNEVQKKLALERKERKAIAKDREQLFNRLEKIKESVEGLETKNAKLKKKYEGEINKILDEKNAEIEERCKQLSDCIASKKELETKFMESLDLNSHMKREVDHLNKMRDMGEKELDNVKRDQGLYNEEM